VGIAAVTPDDSTAETSQRRRILLVAGAALLVVVIGVGLVIAYDVGGLRTRAVNRASEADGDVVFKNMHEHCISGASDTIRKSGADPDAADVKGKIVGYCDCIVADVRAQFTLSEIADLEKDPGQIASDPRMNAIIQRCVAKFRS
jgi:hypothetical protein